MDNRDTLLHFLTRRTSQQVTAEFQRVIADAELPKAEMDKLFKTLFKSNNIGWFYQMDKNEPLSDVIKDPSFKNKFEQGLKNLGKGMWDYFRGKDPLDMTPTDLDNLFKVYRDQSSPPVEIKTIINEQSAGVVLTPEQIKSLVSKFYNDNKNYFESAKDLDYNVETTTLTFKGSEFMLKKLLGDTLKVPGKYMQSILAQRREVVGTWYIPLGPPNKASKDANGLPKGWISDWANEDAFAGDDTFPKFYDAVNQHYKDLVKSKDLDAGHLKWIQAQDKQYFLKFEGSLTELTTLFKSFFTFSKNYEDIIKKLKADPIAYKQEPR
jgi:hypothetical protein